MAVSSILEGYLTIYGWQVYASIFLLLVAVGAVLYPVARIVFEAAIAYGERGGAPEFGARALIIRLTIYMLVLVLGLIPLVPLNLSAVNVQNQCGQEGLAAAGKQLEFAASKDYGFGEIQDARVPLLPYLAMILASGFNAVINQATPCIQDLTNLSLALNTLDFSEAEDPAALRTTVERFEKECGERARRYAAGFLSGAYGSEHRQYMEDLLEKYADDETERRSQLGYFGSKFYRENFYQSCSSGGGPDTPEGKLCMIAPLRAQNPVDGFPYNATRDSDVSQYQAATDQGLPTCEEWWSASGYGVRAQLVEAGGQALRRQASYLHANDCPGKAFLPGSLCMVIATMVNSIEDSEDVIARQMLLSGKRNLLGSDTLLSTGEALFTGALFAFSDVAQNIAAHASGYMVSVFLMKVGSKLLQPFLLMSIFMLWGVYLVIGELRGMALVKGMMLIFALSILPSLWSFADHIDDLLFLTLYPDTKPFTLTNIPAELMAEHSTIERILLTFVTAVFYLILPMLMLYLIAEAGGPSTATNMADVSMNNPARNVGSVGSSVASSTRINGGLVGSVVRAAITKGK
ncbi:MAG: conjugal transfer protein TraG N-terminal domain-containing protein [Candidatus Competibacteraceae bacterium]|nr:conjugal transfer protein TraG N-terminal domain-containing protein [Candidatus Competibacteraceae bacterium]